MNEPLLSVVVPTRNRRESLLRLLHALATDAAAPAFEVIVVDDGSTDGTLEAVGELRPPYPLTLIAHADRGPAGARNAGARVARARVLLFLDDDVEPLAGTLAAHARFHADDDQRIGLGDLPPVLAQVSLFDTVVRGWWETMLIEIRRPGHRFKLQNLLTGHVSIHRAQFAALGGFDPEFRCHEDWEFGYRALAAGLEMRLVPGAVARHHETTDLSRALRRKFDEGVADIQLTRRHPELVRALPFAWPLASRKARALKRLTFVAPRAAATIARGLERMLPVYESVKLRFRWRRTLELLLCYHYWRGVSSVLPDRREVSALIGAAGLSTAHPVVVDLTDGVDAAASRLDDLRPVSIVLTLGDEVIGTVWPWPGLERLRGAHLRPLLARSFRTQYLQALARRGAVPAPLTTLIDALPDAGRHVPHTNAPLVRDEQLPTHAAAGLHMQASAPIPPIHDVA